MITTTADVRLDVLACWRAVEARDYVAARRVLATCDDAQAACLLTLRLTSLLVEEWLGVGSVDAFITRLVARELRADIDQL